MLKFRFSTSSKDKEKKKKKILIPKSEDPVSQFGFKSQSPVTAPSLDIGSKEETFFDSQAWIESDCEDEFLSVNGDFTPRCSFSDHQNSSTENPQLKKFQFINKAPDLNSELSLPSPGDKKMRLSELLNESLGGDEVYDDQNKPDGGLESKPDNPVQPSKSTKGISHLFKSLSRSTSFRSSDKTPNRFSKSEKEKPAKASQCCLPMLIRSFSFSERKKKPTPEYSRG